MQTEWWQWRGSDSHYCPCYRCSRRRWRHEPQIVRASGAGASQAGGRAGRCRTCEAHKSPAEVQQQRRHVPCMHTKARGAAAASQAAWPELTATTPVTMRSNCKPTACESRSARAARRAGVLWLLCNRGDLKTQPLQRRGNPSLRRCGSAAVSSAAAAEHEPQNRPGQLLPATETIVRAHCYSPAARDTMRGSAMQEGLTW